MRTRGSRRTAQEKNLQKELEQLDAAFEEAKTRIQFQKRSAIRWINRQSSRMQIQIQTMEPYRKLICEGLEHEFEECRFLRRRCKEIVEMGEQIQNRRKSQLLSQSHDSLNSTGRLRGSGGTTSFLEPIDGHRVSTPKGPKPEAWNNVR
eukprot:CAMPEP_0117814886 /NCGR_PEP_ID=MMETSP0948-20121206/24449_1 /TAXON_ID=44440 /ORGANISM="Chattonella subsalsa, Strain CCMP2191" /LENGTH=148 /DNA_ID=CAMNT_0005652675 /DNA_START=63 /DNA_END=509 /DNA_ORIENTATION=+